MFINQMLAHQVEVKQAFSLKLRPSSCSNLQAEGLIYFMAGQRPVYIVEDTYRALKRRLIRNSLIRPKLIFDK
jgi:hypothetical protein